MFHIVNVTKTKTQRNGAKRLGGLTQLKWDKRWEKEERQKMLQQKTPIETEFWSRRLGKVVSWCSHKRLTDCSSNFLFIIVSNIYSKKNSKMDIRVQFNLGNLHSLQ